MVEDFLYVSVDGVFPCNDLDLSLAQIREVFNHFPLCVESISDRTDQVHSVVSGFMMCGEYAVGYCLWVV